MPIPVDVLLGDYIDLLGLVAIFHLQQASVKILWRGILGWLVGGGGWEVDGAEMETQKHTCE